MRFTDRLRLLFASKESQARIIMAKNLIGKPVHTPANYEGFARQGYTKNVVAYTAISKIATACAGINWELYSKKGRGKANELEEHPLLTLLDNPNPLQALSSFIEAVVAFRLITGNSYIEANSGLKTGSPPLELWPVRPDRMKVIPGANGYVSEYVFTNSGFERRWEVDPVKLKSQVLHWKTFNPLSDWYGLSPLEAAMLSLDQNNAGQKWNLALLQNSATPSGILQMRVSDANPRGELTIEQYARLKAELDENLAGSRNAGRPLLIEGNLEWKTISLSTKDMDFINNKATTATDVALALGVPPELMGFGAKTYANYKEARLAFYEETILPTMDSLRDSLNGWLTPAFGEGLYLDYDRDDIDALIEKREQKYTSLVGANFLTQNEKRVSAGYDERPGLDVYVIGSQVYTEEDLTAPKEDEVIDDADITEEPDDADKKPPKKPSGDTSEDGGPNEEDDVDADDSKGWKTLNLLNAREKRQSWKRQNARRKRLEAHFKKDIREDFKDLAQELGEAAAKLKGSEPKVIEYALLKVEDEWRPRMRKTLARLMRHSLEDFGNMVLEEGKSLKLGLTMEVKANLKFDSYVTDYIKERTGTQISTISSTNQKQIKRIVSEWVQETITEGDSLPELSQFLQMEFEELSDGRARTIARTEVALASNNGSLEAIKSLGIPNMFKEWVTASDDRVRHGENLGADHSVMNGAEVALEEKFGVPPDSLMEGPGDPAAPADQVINCRCVLVYKSKNTGEL